MGTHPIFESDFDCLTECRNDLLKRIVEGSVKGDCQVGSKLTQKLIKN